MSYDLAPIHGGGNSISKLKNQKSREGEGELGAQLK